MCVVYKTHVLCKAVPKCRTYTPTYTIYRLCLLFLYFFFFVVC